MQHPDEGTIHAWIDGELSVEEAAVLEAHLKECAECSALAAEARGLVAASSRIVSALDIVPGDVIPKTQTQRRPWYLSTQLRAAAAVVIVAGASLLVLKNGAQTKMQRVMQSSAPAAATIDTAREEKELDRLESSAPTAGPVRIAEPPPAKPAPQAIAREKSASAPRDEAAKELEGRVSGVVMNDAIADAAKPVQPLQRRDTSAARRRFAADQLSQVVVTGVATTTEARELKKVRADSAKNETVYEVKPGVEVTLTDNGEPAKIILRSSAQVKQRDVAAPVQASAAAAPPPPARINAGLASSAAATDSISWTSKLGHVMKLKGPLSREELEKIRQRLPEDQR